MAMQMDPVCGMQVDEQKASAKSQHEGRTYYFCSSDCQRKFDQQPEQYVAQKGQSGQPQQSSAAKR